MGILHDSDVHYTRAYLSLSSSGCLNTCKHLWTLSKAYGTPSSSVNDKWRLCKLSMLPFEDVTWCVMNDSITERLQNFLHYLLARLLYDHYQVFLSVPLLDRRELSSSCRTFHSSEEAFYFSVISRFFSKSECFIYLWMYRSNVELCLTKNIFVLQKWIWDIPKFWGACRAFSFYLLNVLFMFWTNTRLKTIYNMLL